MKIKEVCNYLESFAPLALQESYDNAGLAVGNPEQEVKGVLISLDITEELIDQAIEKEANLIVAHHPLIFRPLKSLTGKNSIERTLIKALKNNIALYAAHTNLDNISGGVNSMICRKLQLENCKILSPLAGQLNKIVCFVPGKQAPLVRAAMFEAGAGHIGDYDSCSYNLSGKGSFRGGENSNPFVGEKGKLHFESEERIETIAPKYLSRKIIAAMIQAHPYEEPAYDIYPLENEHEGIGAGMVGYLPEETETKAFLKQLKTTFNAEIIRHTEILKPKLKKVALCGGAGSFLLPKAKAAKADIFISGDFKYHDFFQAEKEIVIADIGHYESEQFTKELIFDLLKEKFTKFAVHLSQINTNPIKYF